MLIDILIILIFLVSLYKGWKQGFLYSIGLIVILIVSFFLASSFSSVLAVKLYDYGVEKEVFQEIKADLSTELYAGKTIGESLSSIGVPKNFQEILASGSGEEAAGLIEELGKTVSDLGEKSKARVDGIAQELTRSLILLTIQILSFILILFVSNFLLRLLLSLISKGVNRLPLIGTTNRVLGLLVSFFFAVLISGLVLSVLPGLQTTFPSLEIAIEESKLAALLQDSSFYQSLLDTIF